MRLILLRHGQTHSNVLGALDTGEPGADLTDLGVRQAVAAAQVLVTRGLGGLYVSTLVRTAQTAAPTASATGLVPQVRPGLREVSAGLQEMKADDESVHTYLHTVASWIHGDLAVRMPGGEDGHEFLARYDDVLAEAAGAGHDQVLVVSHGAAIRTWVSARTDAEQTGVAPTDPLRNTGAIEVDGDPDSGWHVVGWHTEPLGGHLLEDETAPDPTGADAGD